MTRSKRIYDLLFSSLLVIILGPIILWLIFYIWIKEGRPVVLLSEGLVLTFLAVSTAFGLGYPIGLHVVFGLAFFLFFLIGRLGLLNFVNLLYRRSSYRCRVLIYGAGASGTQLAIALRRHGWIEPVAFVDDNVTLQGLRILRLPVYSPIRIAELLREKR